MVEYTTMNLPLELIRSGTVIALTPLPTCVEQTTCSDCLGGSVKRFQCQWCPRIKACSSGADRGWQRWHDNDCHLNGGVERVQFEFEAFAISVVWSRIFNATLSIS
nr:plexin domain containing protein 2 [Hymenolepis microstoma]